MTRCNISKLSATLHFLQQQKDIIPSPLFREPDQKRRKGRVGKKKDQKTDVCVEACRWTMEQVELQVQINLFQWIEKIPKEILIIGKKEETNLQRRK